MSRAEETPVPLRPHILLTCALYMRRHHLFGACPWHTCLGTLYEYIIRGNIIRGNIIRGTSSVSEAHPPRQHHPRHIIRASFSFHLRHIIRGTLSEARPPRHIIRGTSSHSSSYLFVCFICVFISFIIPFICVGGATLADTISSEEARMPRSQPVTHR